MPVDRRALLIESPGVRAMVAAGELEPMDADPIITPYQRAEIERGRKRGQQRERKRARADRSAGVEIVRHRALTGEG